MGRRVYRWLLALLPRRWRQAFGDDMTSIFSELMAAEWKDHGWRGVARLWFRELVGLVRIAGRGWGGHDAFRGPRLATEVRWAWRGVLSRGWTAPFAIALLAVTLASATVAFSVTDSLVLRPYPYSDPDRIVSLVQSSGSTAGLERLTMARLHDEWRREKDLFSAVGVFLSKGGVFVHDGSSTERLETVDVSIGFFDVLGVAPQWGRTFVEADVRQPDIFVAVISDGFARERFGTPLLALGQRLELTAGPVAVVGVMPKTFAFPSSTTKMWRVMDPGGPLTANFGFGLIGRIAQTQSLGTFQARLAERAPAVGMAVGLPAYTATTRPFFNLRAITSERRTMTFVLLAASLALLVTACASVASLELANSLRRSRWTAVHLALGAPRASLIRVLAIEGLMVVATASSVALWLSHLGVRALGAAASARYAVQNPIDLNLRTLAFAAGVTAAAWLLTCIPSLWSASRSALSALLAFGGRTTVIRPASLAMRRVLTVVEVALAVALMVIGVLYARTYRSLLTADKGFDSGGMAVVSTSYPASRFQSPEDRTAFVARILDTVRHAPGVEAATTSAPPPSTGDSPMQVAPEIDGHLTGSLIGLGRKWVDAAYFDVTRLPLLGGRYLEDSDPPTNVVISEAFAHRFWPNESAVGHTFRAAESWYADLHTIVGVVPDFRINPRRMPTESDTRFYVYAVMPRRGLSGVGGPTLAPVDTGGSYGVIDITARLDSPTRLVDLRAAAQRADPQFPVRATLVDDIYAAQNDDARLLAGVVGIFGGITFLVAMGGLYGVMTFMVAGRTREIGVRMALGAERRDIRRLVVHSSARLVLGGCVVGCALAFAVARWIEAQFFEVSPTAPGTYLVVAASVTAVALVATWRPAAAASRVDPAVTLRSE